MKEAIKIFGIDVVNEVVTMVEISDADGMYTMFQDMGKDEQAECVEFMYF